MFLEKYFPPSMVTKLRNEITNFRQRPDELLFEAWKHYKLSIDRCPNHNMLPVTQIDTFYNGLTLIHRDTINAAAEGTFMKRRPEECYDIIENMTAHHNIGILPFNGINQQVKAVAHNCETCGGHHSYNDFPATVGQTQNVYAAGAYNQGGFNQNQNRNNPNQNYQNHNRNQGNNHGIPHGNNQGRNQFFQGDSHGQNPPPAYQAPAYQAPGYQAPTKMTSLKNSNLELKNMFGEFMKMNTVSSSGSRTLPSNTITNPKEDLKGITTRSRNAYKGPTIPTTSSLPKVVERETEVTKDTVPPTNNGSTKDVQPSVVQIETPISNSEPIIAPVVEPVVSPLGDPRKFLIPCDFSGMDECLALADLGASINLMPLSVCNKLSLPELSPTCMTLELADRSISRPIRVAEDVFVKVGTFHFPADFVVVDFDADPRVPLILGRSFLKTGRALIDVYGGELTLRVGKEAITFNLDQTSRYSTNYDAMSVNRIDLIEVACEEYSQKVLGFFMSGNPTPSTEPIVSTSSPTLTPFGDSDFLFEETDAFLAIGDVPISPEIDESYYDLEGDIFLLEEFLNVDPSSPPIPPQELKVVEPTNEKSSIDEPPVVSLKDLPPHLEYAFLEGDDKLPIIIAKDLKGEEKTALIKVLKSHKQALAWQLSDIKGIDLEFSTHTILMEDNFKPAVQHQRKSLGEPRALCSKKGGFTILENEEKELIPARLVTGWRVCIDYQKLNDATRKDHFPLPFMDQMLERLAGNEYYCFLDGFSGYFQIPVDPKDQEKTTFTCPYETFAYRRMPFGLCNAPGTFQRCMIAIFHDMIEETMEVLMDDFSVFENSFGTCLSHLDKMLKRCEDTNLCLNWEKSHFLVKEGIVLSHKISKNGIEVDKVKVDVIAKLPHPTTVKVIRSFLGHAGFYRRFIQDFSKIARPMARLLEKDTLLFFSKECVEAF
nr:reverse transcriptase domain-containing protein [Tanacetum cinerariifolium]